MENLIFIIKLVNDWDECVNTWVANDEETAIKIRDAVESHVDKYTYTVYILKDNLFTDKDTFNPKVELGKLYREKQETIFIPHTDVNNPKQKNTDICDLFKNCKILEEGPKHCPIEDMNGTSVKIKGSVPKVSDLDNLEDATINDAYIIKVDEDIHLFVFNGVDFIDAGVLRDHNKRGL